MSQLMETSHPVLHDELSEFVYVMRSKMRRQVLVFNALVALKVLQHGT